MWESSSEEEREDEEEEKKEVVGMKGGSGVVDVEDVGDMLHRARPLLASRELLVRKRVEKREMVTPLLRKTLSKQGKVWFIHIAVMLHYVIPFQHIAHTFNLIQLYNYVFFY